MRVRTPQQFNVPELLKHDYIFVTKQGLIDLEEILEQRKFNYFRNRKAASDDSIARSQYKLMDVYEREIIRPILEADEIEGYDEEKPLVVQSESLKGYIDDLHKLQ